MPERRRLRPILRRSVTSPALVTGQTSLTQDWEVSAHPSQGSEPLSRSGTRRDTGQMDAGVVYELPDHRRHLAVDERGVGLRATCYLDRGFVNLSLWSDGRCVQTFHMTPVEAGRFVGFLASVLADAVPELGPGSPVEARASVVGAVVA